MSAFALSTTQKKKPSLLCKGFGYAGEKIEPNQKYSNYSKRLRHLIMHPLPILLEQLDGLAHNL